MDAIGMRIEFKTAKWPENLKASRAGKLMMWGVGWSAGRPTATPSWRWATAPTRARPTIRASTCRPSTSCTSASACCPTAPSARRDGRQAKKLMIAYMPYKVHVHRIVHRPVEIHPWVTDGSDDDGTVGTITVGLDGPMGLNTEGTFAAEVDAQRRVARRLCEFTRLAVDSGRGGEGVLAALFHGAYLFAHRQHECDTVLLEVNPRHVRYYQRSLGAKVLGGERTNARVGAPAVLLGLEFAEVTRRLQAPVPPAAGRTLFSRALPPDEERALMSHLRRLHPPSVPPSVYQQWLLERAAALRQLRRALALVGPPTCAASGRRSGTTSTSSRPRPTGGAGASGDARRAWFPGLQLNYAQQALRHADAAHAAGHPAMLFQNERAGAPAGDGLARAAPAGGGLRAGAAGLGVQPATASAPVLPNTPQAIVVPSSACASVGACGRCARPTWGRWRCSTASARSSPRCWWRCDGQVWGGQAHDRRAVLQRAAGRLPSVRHAGAGGRPRPAPTRPTGRRRRGGARLAAADGRRGATRSRRPGCPSTTRCGWSIPAAPPGCPSPSCTAMAASCWRC
jgi:hypothetical protein